MKKINQLILPLFTRTTLRNRQLEMEEFLNVTAGGTYSYHLALKR